MRIGVDAREVCGRTTGVGRYLRALLMEWNHDDRARRHEFVLYAPDTVTLPLDARRFATRTVAGSGGTWWEQVQLPAAIAQDHLDVWFAPAYSAPLSVPIPIVATIHDISFVAHPEWFTMKEGARRRLVVGRTAEQARTIITVSEFSRAEIVERLGIPAEKVRVILHSLAHAVPSHSAHAHPTPRVLFVGSVLNRRHVPDLIRAFAPIARAHPLAHLDIVGDNRSFPFEDLEAVIRNHGLGAQAQWHRYASEERLDELYLEARAFAFLSEYEGFGLTPLEALAAGVPPVLLDTPAARESCGPAALYVPHHDIRAVTRALELALFSESAREAILEAAPAVLARYDSARAARQTLDVLEG